MKRALVLKREALTALTAEQLTGVHGAGAVVTLPVDECPFLQNTNFYCVTRGTTCQICE